MTMRHGPDEHLGRAVLRYRSHQIVSRDHFTCVEHSDTVSPMRTVKYHRAGKRPAALVLRLHVIARGLWQRPGASSARVRTDAWLDAIDRTGPLREAHIVRPFARRPLPGRRRTPL